MRRLLGLNEKPCACRQKNYFKVTFLLTAKRFSLSGDILHRSFIVIRDENTFRQMSVAMLWPMYIVYLTIVPNLNSSNSHNVNWEFCAAFVLVTKRLLYTNSETNKFLEFKFSVKIYFDVLVSIFRYFSMLQKNISLKMFFWNRFKFLIIEY